MGRLVKIGFPCHTLTVRLGLRPYLHGIMMGHTSGHDTIHPLFFRENLIFSLLFAYSPIPRATRNTLKPPNLDHILHAT
jgi:hypothetical protein